MRRSYLVVLEKLFPHFHNFPSVDCEFYHYAKHHRVSSPPRVNKKAILFFYLVYSNVWCPCSVPSKKWFLVLSHIY